MGKISKYLKLLNSAQLLLGQHAPDRSRIFDRFHRGDPARTRNVEGIGLLLSLAREIARAHRGDLTLDSTKKGRTAFTLTLPISSPSIIS